jgi:hypothetical protein
VVLPAHLKITARMRINRISMRRKREAVVGGDGFCSSSCCSGWLLREDMLGLRFCAPTGDETDFRVGESKISYCLSLFNHKSTKAKRGKQKNLLFDIYFFHSSLFLCHPSSWLCFEGPQNCVSPICSHSDNHRSRITSGLPCQLWLIRFHHRTQVNLSQPLLLLLLLLLPFR